MSAEAQEHVLEKCNVSIAKPRSVTILTLCVSVFEFNNSVSPSMWFGYDRLLTAIIVFQYTLIRQIHPFL